MRLPSVHTAIVTAAVAVMSFVAPAMQEQAQSTKSKDVVVVGCLTTRQAPGQTQTEFIITQEGTGHKFAVASSVDLLPHVNHKIKVTGKTDAQKNDVLTVAMVEHIADSCSASK